MIPYGRQNISQEDINSVLEVLTSDFLTQGPKVPQFEKAIAGYCGSKYATAVNSATSALHIACRALELGPGDLLWTSPITFVASANCALYCGAQVDFVDINPQTYNLCVDTLEEKLLKAETAGQLPKIIIPVHFAGQSCEMKKIHSLSKRFGFKIIEDASHAIGGKYLNEPVGSCEYSDITVFSFHPVKIITTAEGGIALTNDENLSEKMALLRSHGVTREEELMTEETHGSWYYQQVDLGFNYRMTELQAALGISQLSRLNEFVNRRQLIAKKYDELLKELPVKIPFQHEDTYSSYHLYPICLNSAELSITRKQFFDLLRGADIGVNVHYIPVHTQPFFKKMGFNTGDFPIAEKYYSQAVSLPLYPDLSTENQNYIVEQVKLNLQ